MTDNEMNRLKLTLDALMGKSGVVVSDNQRLSRHVFDTYRRWLLGNPFFYDVVGDAEFRCTNGHMSVSFPAYGGRIQFLTYGEVPRSCGLDIDGYGYMWAAIDDV